MEIIHIAAECYPYAKVGGLGDVVGALPKYQNKLGHVAKVVLPMYKTKFLQQNEWEHVHSGSIHVGKMHFTYHVIKEKTNKLGFDFYAIDINGLLDRPEVYGYHDDHIRFLAFQIATLNWICHWNHKPDVIHCHDHHTGFIPFLMKYASFYNQLANVKSIFTIHNAQYQGWLSKELLYLIPEYDVWKTGLLEWDGVINPLAAAVKSAWKVSAVSPTYMNELKYEANGLEALFEYEKGKCIGIINGIDNEVWNPKTDSYLREHFDESNYKKGKLENKKLIADTFGFDYKKPLISFIGRFVGEKAADILPQALAYIVLNNPDGVNCLVLGSGDKVVEAQLLQLKNYIGKQFDCFIGYNEALSHEIYAGSDFLLMPSRVEPCGLNQLYALRYGTIPIVRNTGGLNDTVVDIGIEGGYGIKMAQATVSDINFAVMRGLDLFYKDHERFEKIQKQIMGINFSWENSAAEYIKLYQYA
jgi:starch synthase